MPCGECAKALTDPPHCRLSSPLLLGPSSCPLLLPHSSPSCLLRRLCIAKTRPEYQCTPASHMMHWHCIGIGWNSPAPVGTGFPWGCRWGQYLAAGVVPPEGPLSITKAKGTGTPTVCHARCSFGRSTGSGSGSGRYLDQLGYSRLHPVVLSQSARGGERTMLGTLNGGNFHRDLVAIWKNSVCPIKSW